LLNRRSAFFFTGLEARELFLDPVDTEGSDREGISKRNEVT
jgi:hypothetical protein